MKRRRKDIEDMLDNFILWVWNGRILIKVSVFGMALIWSWDLLTLGLGDFWHWDIGPIADIGLFGCWVLLLVHYLVYKNLVD